MLLPNRASEVTIGTYILGVKSLCCRSLLRTSTPDAGCSSLIAAPIRAALSKTSISLLVPQCLHREYTNIYNLLSQNLAVFGIVYGNGVLYLNVF